MSGELGRDHMGWNVVGGTWRGSTHTKAETPCQDAVAFSIDTSDCGRSMVLAVADGAGSAPLAEIGAEIAVATVRRLSYLLYKRPEVRPRCTERVLRALFMAARHEVIKEAVRRNATARELATTLTVAVLTRSLSAVGRIGDGLVAIRGVEGKISTPLLLPDREYANEADFLTSSSWRTALRIAVLEDDVDAVAVSSDGLRMVATSNVRTGEPFAPFYEDMFGAIAAGADHDAIERFLSTVEDRTGDDKSLLIAVRA